MSTSRIGVIADDYTGAVDVATAFRDAGARTRIIFGRPTGRAGEPCDDVVVVALKSRAIPAEEAVALSLRAHRALLEGGAERFLLKVCSTFDSTAAGNIGPVADALADVTGSTVTLVTPSSPSHGRTLYLGHLFVYDRLLSESPMRHHPQTPMEDSDVVRVLASQTSRRVALIRHSVVREGAQAVREEMSEAQRTGTRYLVADAINDADLAVLADAVDGSSLIVGAAGLARGVGYSLSRGYRTPEGPVTPTSGPAAVLSGSCSAQTLRQIEAVAVAGWPIYRIDPLAADAPEGLAASALGWYDSVVNSVGAAVFSSSATRKELAHVHAHMSPRMASSLLEAATGLIAQGLVERGVRNIVCAGGETSGVVAEALEVRSGTIGNRVAPGVAWIHSADSRELSLLLKSGNFGSEEFFLDAVSGARSNEQLRDD